MSTVDWILVGAVWLLIPLVLALKAWRDHEDAKSQRELMARLSEPIWKVRQP